MPLLGTLLLPEPLNLIPTSYQLYQGFFLIINGQITSFVALESFTLIMPLEIVLTPTLPVLVMIIFSQKQYKLVPIDFVVVLFEAIPSPEFLPKLEH